MHVRKKSTVIDNSKKMNICQTGELQKVKTYTKKHIETHRKIIVNERNMK